MLMSEIPAWLAIACFIAASMLAKDCPERFTALLNNSIVLAGSSKDALTISIVFKNGPPNIAFNVPTASDADPKVSNCLVIPRRVLTSVPACRATIANFSN